MAALVAKLGQAQKQSRPRLPAPAGSRAPVSFMALLRRAGPAQAEVRRATLRGAGGWES